MRVRAIALLALLTPRRPPSRNRARWRRMRQTRATSSSAGPTRGSRTTHGAAHSTRAAPVVWTASLYDVDGRSFFLVAFDRAGIRIYRFGQFVSPLRAHMGVPEWPGREQGAFWGALAGRVDDRVGPEAFVPWSSVRELKSGNWVLWFRLDRRVAIASGRGKRKP